LRDRALIDEPDGVAFKPDRLHARVVRCPSPRRPQRTPAPGSMSSFADRSSAPGRTYGAAEGLGVAANRTRPAVFFLVKAGNVRFTPFTAIVATILAARSVSAGLDQSRKGQPGGVLGPSPRWAATATRGNGRSSRKRSRRSNATSAGHRVTTRSPRTRAASSLRSRHI
jgi:hypothetical protein